MVPETGVISVGGRGMRFGRPGIQKCLTPIAGRPILEYTVSAFVQAGVKSIVLLTGFLHDQVEEYVAHRSGQMEQCSIHVVFGGTEGQIGALLKIRHLLVDDFLYAGGDCVFPSRTVQTLIKKAELHPESVAIAAVNMTNETVISHPRIQLTEGTDLIEAMNHPTMSSGELVGMGMYYFRPNIFRFFEQADPDPLQPTSAFAPYARSAGEVITASITNDPWLCLHTERDLQILESLDVGAFLR